MKETLRSQERVAVDTDSLSDALLAIDTNSGQIISCNEIAQRLLGTPAVSPQGQLWSQVLGDDPAVGQILGRALRQSKHVVLPPFAISRNNEAQLVVAGMVLPRSLERPEVSHVLLWPLLEEAEQLVVSDLEVSDVVAVPGVDQLHYDDHWGSAQTAALMLEIRSRLQDIVRAGDAVALPRGAALLISLRAVDTSEARDICTALLSHLRRILLAGGGPAAQLRIRIGLASSEAGASAVDALLAANNALLQAQTSGSREPIHVACATTDSSSVVGRVLNEGGVFNGAAATLSNDIREPPSSRGGLPSPAVASVKPSFPPVSPIEKDIDGYVVDNMEGAVDQAIFLAKLDIPVAIIGPAGTGKLYVAKIIHDQSGAARDMFLALDCREFRSRNAANKAISRALSQGEGKTLVFKSPHLMNVEAQLKLARQISSRTLADVSPPQYLPQMKLVALFPDTMEHLLRRGELAEQLASVFSGYPIQVPPIRDRKQAVLRWAHKILVQEGVIRDREMKGFTPDAEQAMLLYDWPGNISEMRQCIYDALEKTDKDWLTPVDLGLFKGINPDGAPHQPEPQAFLSVAAQEDTVDDAYIPSTLEALDTVLAEAVHSLLELKLVKPLGTWMEDELVLAALDRYRGDLRTTGEFLHTKPRNISRWLGKIQAREAERSNSSLWQKPRRILREWVRETPQVETSPMELIQDRLMIRITEQGAALSAAKRARIMGVSTPTYLKRIRELSAVK